MLFCQFSGVGHAARPVTALPDTRKDPLMIQTVFKMTLGLGILALAAQQVSAQGSRNCAPRPVVVERLADGYGETRQSIGLGARGALVEVFASQETGSWTITVTTPAGLTCLIASGQSFESVTEALPAAGEDA